LPAIGVLDQAASDVLKGHAEEVTLRSLGEAEVVGRRRQAAKVVGSDNRMSESAMRCMRVRKSVS
jgi:hypothetical protein